METYFRGDLQGPATSVEVLQGSARSGEVGRGRVRSGGINTKIRSHVGRGPLSQVRSVNKNQSEHRSEHMSVKRIRKANITL